MAAFGNMVGRLFGRKQRTGDADGPGTEIATLPPRTDRARQAAAFPGFLASAIDRALGRGERPEIQRARIALREVFTPSQPVKERGYFAGRLDTLTSLIEILEGQRAHVVIYGERGIGKTSLLHILADVARESQYIVVYDSCGAHSRFDEMFRAILRDVPLLYLSSVSPTSSDAEKGATLADRLPEGKFDARQLGDLCAQITGTRVMIVLDEYDRVEDPAFRQSVAELIKNLSDRAARVQLVISGVASNLQELVGYIPSIRRNVVGLPMPRLGDDDVRALIALGENVARVRFAPAAVDEIARIANGSPYLTRLLSHHASTIALDDGRLEVGRDDLRPSLEKTVRETEGRIDRGTVDIGRRLAGDTSRRTIAAAARAASTPDGWFSADDVTPHLDDGDRAAASTDFARLVAMPGIIQTSQGGAGTRYRFADEALPMYLSMLVARDTLHGDGRA